MGPGCRAGLAFAVLLSQPWVKEGRRHQGCSPISACGPGFLLLELTGAPAPLRALSRSPGLCRAMGHLLAEADG